ncbi:hypothetical protein [Tistrella mobilis]|jgi:hypothetical protein|uniref:hypothetical protein n=1 Tax=Tistrella mobilis TaxID=171437 RepID=UPI003557FAE5
MRYKILILAAGLAITPVAVQAGGVPTFDGAALSQDARAYAEELAELQRLYNQLAEQSAQAIRNARRLGDLGGLADALAEYAGLVDDEAARTILQEIYGLDPDRTDFRREMFRILGQEYDLPEDEDDIRQAFREVGASEAVIDALIRSSSYLQVYKDRIAATSQSLADSNKLSEENRNFLNDVIDDYENLGDDSVASTLQLSAGIAISQSNQLEQLIDEIRALREQKVEEKIEKMEKEKLALERELRRQEEVRRRTEATHTPVRIMDWARGETGQ